MDLVVFPIHCTVILPRKLTRDQKCSSELELSQTIHHQPACVFLCAIKQADNYTEFATYIIKEHVDAVRTGFLECITERTHGLVIERLIKSQPLQVLYLLITASETWRTSIAFGNLNCCKINSILFSMLNAQVIGSQNTPTTLHPLIFAICPTREPTAPAAPFTTSVSPSLGVHRRSNPK